MNWCTIGIAVDKQAHEHIVNDRDMIISALYAHSRRVSFRSPVSVNPTGKEHVLLRLNSKCFFMWIEDLWSEWLCFDQDRKII